MYTALTEKQSYNLIPTIFNVLEQKTLTRNMHLRYLTTKINNQKMRQKAPPQRGGERLPRYL